MKRIIVRLQEGLGNQLFQYVLWRRLRERFPEAQVLLDDSRMRVGKRTLGLFEVVEPEPLMRLTWWDLRKAKYARKARLTAFNRWGFHLHWILQDDVADWEDLCAQVSACGDCMVEGFWQWTEVHGPLLATLGEAVHRRFPAENRPLPLQELAQRAIAVHIRLDDYLLPQNEALFPTQTTAYFLRAIDHLHTGLERPELVIFTDSPGEVLNFHPQLAAYRLHWAVDYCEHHIDEFLWLKDFHRVVISNSTFSYWASSLHAPGMPEKHRVFPRNYSQFPERNAHYLAGKKFVLTPSVTLL